ncbi:MAG: DUF6382 domain-containing protein [Candidatus Merdisoma sp.]
MGFIYETQGNITFLVYELSRDEGLEPMTMGMMENNRIEGIIPAVYTQIDERRLLKYNVSARVSLKQYFSGSVAKRQMLGILFSLVSAFLAAEEYMLEPKFFELDPEWIFVDVSRVKAGMICLPVEKEEEEDEQVRLDEFFKQLVFGVRFDTAEDSGYVAKLISFLNGGRTFSLQELQKLLKELMKEENAPFAAERQPQASTSGPEALARQGENRGSGGALQTGSAGALSLSRPDTSPQQVVWPETGQPGEMPVQGIPDQDVSVQGIPGQPRTVPAELRTPVGQAEQSKKQKFGLFGSKKEKAPKSEKPVKEKKAKEKPVKEKKSLFGGKKKEKDSQPSYAAVGFQVPGQPVVMPQAGSSASVGHAGAPAPGPQAAARSGMQNSSGSGQPVRTVPGNFGSTVVLNGGESAGTVVLSAQPDLHPRAWLLRVRNSQRMYLDKNVVRMGSDQSYVDLVIPDNRAVSRSHADILCQEDGYYVRDNNSTNHTYLNGQAVAPGQLVRLEDGARLRLADEDFEVHLT